MQCQNMPPKFFPDSHWWWWPLLALPETLLARWIRHRLRKLSPSVQETPLRELWQGKGSILLLTQDPTAFRLLPWIRLCSRQFPGLRIVILSEQAAWWQALVPGLEVVALPSGHVFGNAPWWKENLPRLVGDWCIDLHPGPAHPLSLALADIAGRSWRIGTGDSKLRNIRIESNQTHPFDGSILRALASTFQWAEPAEIASSIGKQVFLHLPSVPFKKRQGWVPALLELQRKYKATVVGQGDLQGWESLSPTPMPSASNLLSLGIGTWIGIRSAASGALSATGTKHIELPSNPGKMHELRN
jgi:hypothetical protein